MNNNLSRQIIYSPEERIPIGEPVILPDGGHGIKLKWRRGKRDVTEIVTLDKLHELVVQGRIRTSSQGSPSRRNSATDKEPLNT